MSPLPATSTASGPSRATVWNALIVADVHVRERDRRGKIASLSANAATCK